MNTYFITLISLAILAPQHVLAGQADTVWKESKYEVNFSLRCSKGPRKTTFAKNDTYWFDQLYLRWDGESLNRLIYSTTIEAPHDWHGGESGYTFKRKENGGESIIKQKSLERNLEGKYLQVIDIELDATSAPELAHFNDGFFTHGAWRIKIEDRIASIKESTSTFYKGKLSDANSSNWSNCRLMDPFGNP